jgi:Brp/Blh family beta-carotene 15,15'-monooxygenase
MFIENSVKQNARVHILWVLALAILFLFLQLLGLRIPIPVQNWILILGILLGGIPHGAIDHIIRKEENRLDGKPFNLFRFYFQYLAAMGFYALIWYYFPVFSLILFILITAWHFGETDLFIDSYPNQFIRSGFYMIYGLWVILFLLFSHEKEVVDILHTLNIQSLNQINQILLGFQDWNYWVLIIIGLLLWVLNGVLLRNWSSNLLLQLGFLFILSFLSLAISFTLYFTAWHSLRSLNEIAHFLKKGISMKEFLSLFLPNTLLALLFLGGLYYYWIKSFPMGSFILLVFILLSLLTLPHFLIMHFLFDRERKEEEILD